MSVQAPPRTEIPAAEPTPQRRRPWLLLASCAVVAAVLAVGGLSIARYQPLATGSVGPALGSTGFKVIRDRDAFPSDSENLIQQLTYVDGQTVTYAFDLLNTGRWGVTVTSIDGGHPELSLLRPFAVLVAPKGACCVADQGTLRPFHPFSLGAGESRLIVIRARFANCASWGLQSTEGIGPPDIAYRVLGFHRHASFLVGPWRLDIPSPPDSSCPLRRPSP